MKKNMLNLLASVSSVPGYFMSKRKKTGLFWLGVLLLLGFNAVDVHAAYSSYIDGQAHNWDAGWYADTQGHWHQCKLCGQTRDYAEHVNLNNDLSCDVCGNTVPHYHEYADGWSYNRDYHWHTCGCGDKIDLATHDYGDDGCETCYYGRTRYSVTYQILGSDGSAQTSSEAVFRDAYPAAVPEPAPVRYGQYLYTFEGWTDVLDDYSDEAWYTYHYQSIIEPENIPVTESCMYYALYRAEKLGDGPNNPASGSIRYPVAPGDSVAFSPEDFTRFFQNTYPGENLSYIIFSPPGANAFDYGSLRYQNQTLQQDTLAFYRFYVQPSNNNEMALSALRFTALKGFSRTVTLTFTACGNDTYYSLSGTLYIQPAQGSITYTASENQIILFREEDFNTLFRKTYPLAMLEYIIFDTPSNNLFDSGVLYRNYNQISQEKLTADILSHYRFYYRADVVYDNLDSLNALAYQGNDDFYDRTFTLTFTAYGTNGQSIDGSVKLVGGSSVTETGYVFITGYFCEYDYDYDYNDDTVWENMINCTASAIFLNGAMRQIPVDMATTNKSIQALLSSGTASSDLQRTYYHAWRDYNDGSYDTSGTAGEYNLNRWFSYRLHRSGKYMLEPVNMAVTRCYDRRDNDDVLYNTHYQDSICNIGNFAIVDSDNSNSTGSPIRLYGDKSSIYLTTSLGEVDTPDGIYTGISTIHAVYSGASGVKLTLENEMEKLRCDSLRGEYNLPQIYTMYNQNRVIIASVLLCQTEKSTDTPDGFHIPDIPSDSLGVIQIYTSNGIAVNSVPGTDFLSIVTVRHSELTAQSILCLAGYTASGQLAALEVQQMNQAEVYPTGTNSEPVLIFRVSLQNSGGRISRVKAFLLSDWQPVGKAITFPVRN